MYCETLDEKLLPSARTPSMGHERVFQCGSDAKHTTKENITPRQEWGKEETH